MIKKEYYKLKHCIEANGYPINDWMVENSENIVYEKISYGIDDFGTNDPYVLIRMVENPTWERRLHPLYMERATSSLINKTLKIVEDKQRESRIEIMSCRIQNFIDYKSFMSLKRFRVVRLIKKNSSQTGLVKIEETLIKCCKLAKLDICED